RGVLGPPRALPDREGLGVERLRLRVTALARVEPPQAVEARAQAGVLRPESLGELEGLLPLLLGLGVLPLLERPGAVVLVHLPAALPDPVAGCGEERRHGQGRRQWANRSVARRLRRQAQV